MKRYFVYSPDLGFDLFDTMKEAVDVAQSEIDGYRDCCDPEWPDDVEFVYVGEVFAKSKKIDIDYDEDGVFECADFVIESLPKEEVQP